MDADYRLRLSSARRGSSPKSRELISLASQADRLMVAGLRLLESSCPAARDHRLQP
jgi:hypothetical protein